MRKKRTILLVSPYWKESHRWMVSTVKLADLWRRRGHRVHVVCMAERTETIEHDTDFTIHTVKDFFLPDPWNYGIAFGFSRHVVRRAKEVRPDVVVVNKVLFWSSLSLFSLRLRGYRVLLLTDALVGMTWWPRSPIAKACAFLYAWSLGWLLLLAANRIVFFHAQPRCLLSFLCIRRKSRVIPTGIDETAYAAAKRDPAHVRITYVGRLESVKGVDDLVGVAIELAARHAFVLQIVGWCRPDHPLVKRHHRKSFIHFLGLRNDVASLLAETDIFVLPSYSEGLSNALMEAMASSCACVATRVGGSKTLLVHKKSGLLYGHGKREELSRHLSDLLVDKERRAALGHEARKRIEEHFSWKKVGEAYDELFASAT